MRDVLSEIDRWRAEGQAVAVATVIRTWGSAPRGVGAKMAVSADGRIAGSVSGGCVEGAVVEAAGEVLTSGRPQRLRFGVADESAWALGLSCGGTIEVFVEPLDAAGYEPLRAAVLAERTAVAATVVAGPALGRKLLLIGDQATGSLGEGLDAPGLAAARDAAGQGRTGCVALEAGCELFVDVQRPSPTLVMVGGVHIAVALCGLARRLGFRTVVVDPRPAFANAERFPHADLLVSAWPDEALAKLGLGPETAVAVLTHDPKLDDPALRAALPSAAFYVGALGSKATQERRRQRLLEAGLSEASLARLHAPIGLHLGGRTPEEIALSVLAQVVAVRNHSSS